MRSGDNYNSVIKIVAIVFGILCIIFLIVNITASVMGVMMLREQAEKVEKMEEQLYRQNKAIAVLTGDVGETVDLDLGITDSSLATAQEKSPSVYYEIADQLTIPLRADPGSGDTTAHYAVVGVTLSLNTIDSCYAAYGADMDSQANTMKEVIYKVISSYTLSDINYMGSDAIQQKILEGLNEKYGSDFISGVSFSSWLIS